MFNKEKECCPDNWFGNLFFRLEYWEKNTAFLVMFEFSMNNNALTPPKKPANIQTTKHQKTPKETKNYIWVIIYKLKTLNFLSKEFQDRNSCFIFNFYDVFGWFKYIKLNKRILLEVSSFIIYGNMWQDPKGVQVNQHNWISEEWLSSLWDLIIHHGLRHKYVNKYEMY